MEFVAVALRCEQTAWINSISETTWPSFKAMPHQLAFEFGHVRSMAVKILPLLLMCLSASITSAQVSQIQPKITNAALKRMIRDARTSDQFEQLASYYDQQAKDSDTKVHQEQAELARLQARQYHPRIYGIQVETLRNHITSDTAHTKQFSERATFYHQKASSMAGQSRSGELSAQTP